MSQTESIPINADDVANRRYSLLRRRKLTYRWLAIWSLGLLFVYALSLVAVPIAVVVYAIGFVVIAVTQPAVALATIFAVAPFQYDLSAGFGVKFSLAEISIALFTPIVLIRYINRFTLGPLTIPVLLYFVVSVVSTLLNDPNKASVVSLVQMFLYLVLVVGIFASAVKRPDDLVPSLHFLAAIGFFLGIASIVTGGGYVLGLHKNGVGASLAFALIVTAGLWIHEQDHKIRRKLMICLAVIGGGLLLTLSRGAWLGSIMGLFVLCLMFGRLSLILWVSMILVPGILILWFLLPEQSRDYATDLDADSHNIRARLNMIEYAMGWFKTSPIIGVGVGLRKDYDATNVVMSTLAETGLLGLASFVLIHVAFGRMVWSLRRLPRDSTGKLVVAIATALMCNKLVHGQVDHYWGRGPCTMAFAAVGMAVLVWRTSRQGISSTPQGSA